MSRTYKIQRSRIAYKDEFPDYSDGLIKSQEIHDRFRGTSQRWGDQRKMRAKLKVSNRRIEKKKDKRAAFKEEFGSE